MKQQIAVRLDGDLVAFVDGIVESGGASSRAAVIARALEREQRRLVAARDAEILARTEPDPDLEAIVRDTAQAMPHDV